MMRASASPSQLPLKLFVYGTLMKGYKYHYAMARAIYLGTARTVEKYAMFASDYPFVSSLHSHVPIVGELYELNDLDSLRIIDEIEGHPTDYIRTPIEVTLDLTGERIAAQIYFNDNLPTSDPSVEYISSGSFHDSRLAPHRKV
jgi:gamma-glutamylaminecyclotransferase